MSAEISSFETYTHFCCQSNSVATMINVNNFNQHFHKFGSKNHDRVKFFYTWKILVLKECIYNNPKNGTD